jgi:tetratricopeptide (TPR) repeat protein
MPSSLGASRFLRCTFVTFLGLAACARPQGAVPNYPPLAAIERDTQATSPVSVSLLRVEYHFADDGSYTRAVRQKYAILDARAVDSWGASEARWSPWRSDKPRVTATVTSHDGTVSRLEPTSLSEAAAYPEAPEMYGDERVLRGPLPNVGVGSIIDEQVVTQTRKPYVGGAETFVESMQVGVPRERVEIVVDAPEALPLRYQVHAAQVTTSDVHRAGRHVVSFTGGPFGGIKGLEPDAPSNVVEWPYLSFGTGTAWRPLAAAYAGVVRDKLGDNGLEAVVAKVVSPADSPRAKSDKVLAWLRDRVRYVGVEFGDSSIVPRTPAETLGHGYGDCKDQAVLLVGLLRAAGLSSARVALLDAGSGQDIDPSLPALNAFDHAIVVVPGADAAGGSLWIDPTATRARAGELPIGDQGRYALVVDSDTDALVRTPTAGDETNTYREVREVFLPSDGGARVLETSTATGSIERGLRDNFDVSAEDLTKWHKDYVSKTYAAKQAGSVELSKVRDLSQPLRMRCEALDARMATANLLDASVQITPSPAFGWVPKSLSEGEERKSEFALHMPYQAEVVYEIHPGSNFVLDTKPSLPDLAMGPATLKGSLEERADGTIVVRYRFVLPKSRWTPREVNDFRKAFEAYGNGAIPLVSLVHHGQKLHKERHFEQELRFYRDDVQAHPRDAAAKMRLAQALLGLGYGTSARQLAVDATKLAPDDRTLWEYAGYIRSRDLLGRREVAGWDRDGAVAAYREAMRVDPTSTFAAVNAAVTLEYDTEARRYAPGSRLEEAVAMFDRIGPEGLASYDNGAYVANPIFDLLRLGRYDEVRARLAKMDPKKAPRVPAIVSAAVLGGTNAALAEATRVLQPDDDRATILGSAADILVELRHYPEASALDSAAAEGSSNEQLRRRAELLSKTRPVDASALPATRPVEVVRKALALCTAKPSTLKADLKPLLDKDQADEKTETFGAFCEGLGKGDSFDGRAPRSVLADVFLGATDLSADGRDAVGYRVRATSGEYRFVVFVDREGGAYRIRAIDRVPSAVGCAALAFQKAGRKDAAGQWLSWARELMTPAGGDDPLRDGPFVRLWTDKKDDVEASAAALCAAGGHPDLTVPTLKAARAQATGERATSLDYAVVLAYVDDGHEAERLAAATVLLADAPTSYRAWSFKRTALASLGRFQALRDEAAARVAKAPTDVDALWDLARAEAQLGRFAESRAVGERLIATGKVGAVAYNEQAWRSLFTTAVTEQDLGYALKAANANPNDASTMNTLAAVDAALGHVADAREHFVRSIELRKKALGDADYFVLGRIAEQLGLPDEAEAAYGHVTQGNKAGGQYTTEHLATARLKVLK